MSIKEEAIVKALGIVGGIASAGIAIVKLADAASDTYEKQKAKRENMIPVPNLIGVDITQAQECIRDLDLLYASKPVKPSIKYKDEEAETVVRMSHKPKTKVHPKVTVITLDYITQDIIVESNRLFLEREYKKEKAKEAKQLKLVKTKKQVKDTLTIKKKELST